MMEEIEELSLEVFSISLLSIRSKDQTIFKDFILLVEESCII